MKATNRPSQLDTLRYQIDLLKKLENEGVPLFLDCLRINDAQIYGYITEMLSFDMTEQFRPTYLENKNYTERLDQYLGLAILVQKMHALKKQHKNICPENIMGSDISYSKLKLIDFDLKMKDHV